MSEEIPLTDSQIEVLVDCVQKFLDEQTDNCSCSSTFQGNNVYIRGGKMSREEWGEMIVQVVEHVYKTLGWMYYIHAVDERSSRIIRLFEYSEYEEYLTESQLKYRVKFQ